MFLLEWECLIDLFVLFVKFVDRLIANEEVGEVNSVFGIVELLIKLLNVLLNLRILILLIDFLEAVQDVLLDLLLRVVVVFSKYPNVDELLLLLHLYKSNRHYQI